MTLKYHPSDDGSVIDGKTVVFLNAGHGEQLEPEAARESAAGPPAKIAPAARARHREQDAAAQAAALTVAAKDGIPFCEECEKARKARAAAQ
jgi:hypothetical protein